MNTSASAQPIRFTEQQRARLRGLSLLPAQVERLEEILPSCSGLLREIASMTEVRDKLGDVAKGLRSAYRICDGSLPGSLETLSRLHIAAAETWPDPFSAPDVLVALQNMAEAAELALRALPQEQRRSNDATPLPIGRIERALLQGFLDHHQSGRPDRPAPPAYRLKTSITKPPFREITAIVYEAIGMEFEPERAIRAYIKLRKEHKSRRHLATPKRSATSTIAEIDAAGPFCLIPRAPEH